MAKFEKGENPKIQYNGVKRHLYTYFGLSSSDHIPSTIFKNPKKSKAKTVKIQCSRNIFP